MVVSLNGSEMITTNEYPDLSPGAFHLLYYLNSQPVIID